MNHPNVPEVVSFGGRQTIGLRHFFAAGVSLLLVLFNAGLLLAQDVAPEDRVRRLRVPLPIVGSVDQIVKRQIEQTIAQTGPEDLVLVLQLTPSDETGGVGSQFERSLSLARFLTSRNLQQVRTVAYIPEEAIGHAVLVAAACEEIVMAPAAIIGDAGRDEAFIGPTLRGGYAEIARTRRTLPDAVALAMLDSELELLQITTDDGVSYAYREQLEEIRQQRDDIRSIDTLVPPGTAAKFRGERMRELRLVSALASDLDDLADFLQVPLERLEFDPSLIGDWRPFLVELDGPISPQTSQRVMRTIQQQVDGQRSNFVLLRINSPGGDLSESVRLANFLADMDPSLVRTVAYITREALADAMVVAYACDHIVAQADAVLGGAGAVSFGQEDLDDLQPLLQRISRRTLQPWSPIYAMVASDAQLFRYQRRGTEAMVYLSPEEFEQRIGDSDDYERREAVTVAGKPLSLNALQAQQFGAIRFVVEDQSHLLRLYNLEELPELIGPNWALDFIEALASPQLAVALLFFGGFALMAELSSPGLGLGAFVAALCFLLYFWSNFLHGNAQMLEILLFLAGVGFVLVELLVIPGFGLFGLGGGALIVASIILAAQTFVFPANEYQMQQLPRSLAIVGAAAAGIVVGVLLLQRYFHRVPVLGRVALMPPDEDARLDLARRESIVDYDHLIGAVGTAQTRLSPSGKAIFNTELINVISDGQLIDPGTAVEVIEVVGNRVIVEAKE